MRAELAEVGARVVDSYQFSATGTLLQAQELKASGIDAVFGYLGVIDAVRLGYVLDTGMAFLPVTLANDFDGARAVARMQALGVPPGVTCFLDVENVWPSQVNAHTLVMPVSLLESRIDDWASHVDAATFEPGLYPGSPQPLTSEQLWQRKVRRYWNALSDERDLNGQLAEPQCGWCVFQMYPSKVWRNTGVLVDMNMIGEDYMGRRPTWAVK